MMRSKRKIIVFLPFFMLLLMLISAPTSFSKKLFEEDFSKGIDDKVWVPHDSWEVTDGALDWLAPSAWSVGYTKKADFTDFLMYADIKLGTNAAFAIRVKDENNYYMFQYDISDPSKVIWFHTFSEKLGNGYVVEKVPTELLPEKDKWYRWELIAQGYHFELYLAELGKKLELAGIWDDKDKTYDSGAVGFWQYGGETFYDNILVTDLKGEAINIDNRSLVVWGKIKNGY